MYHIFPSYHYYEHPTDPNYLIFTLRRKDMAEYFSEQLTKAGIGFETDTDVNPQKKKLYHFAILQSNRKKAMEIFLSTWAKFRKPFFANSVVKTILWVFILSLITLAIIGFIKN